MLATEPPAVTSYSCSRLVTAANAECFQIRGNSALTRDEKTLEKWALLSNFKIDSWRFHQLRGF
jgi:hypothetical protein